MKRFSFVATVLTAALVLATGACNSNQAPDASETTDETPALTGVIQADGVSMITEFPELLEVEKLPGGYAYNQHAYKGYYVANDPTNFANGSEFVGITWILYRPGEPGEGMNPSNIVYQYALMQQWDKDNDMIFAAGEFVPGKGDENPRAWVTAGTGKYTGLKGTTGMWYWLWPDHIEQPEVPEGVDYPNAQELTFNFTGSGETIADTLKEKSLGTPMPGGGERFEGNGVQLWRQLDEFFATEDLPGPVDFDRHVVDFEIVTEDPDNPLNGVTGTSMNWVVFQPETPGGEMNADNVIYQSVFARGGDPDGDQIWFAGDFIPSRGDDRGHAWAVVGSGKFEGAKATTTWYWTWPDHIQRLDDLQGWPEQTPGEIVIELAE